MTEWYVTVFDSSPVDPDSKIRVSESTVSEDTLKADMGSLLDYLRENADSYLVLRQHRPIPGDE